MIIKKRKTLGVFAIKQQYTAAPYIFLTYKMLVYEADDCSCASGGGDVTRRAG